MSISRGQVLRERPELVQLIFCFLANGGIAGSLAREASRQSKIA